MRERGSACNRCHFALEQRAAQTRADEGWSDAPSPHRQLYQDVAESVLRLLGWPRRG